MITARYIFALVLAIFGLSSAFSPRPHHFRRHYETEWQLVQQGNSRFQNNSEPYFRNIRQITQDGVNAEAYWSFDGKQFSFQAIRGNIAETHPCDQIYTMNANGENIQLLSPVSGRDTCSYFSPNGRYVYYGSTGSVDGKFCAPTPDMAYGYLWPIYEGMELYKQDVTSPMSKPIQLTNNSFYDAELTISADGRQMVFTSSRNGDLELFIVNTDGTGLRQMTYTPGYDGGAWFSHNGTKLVWRASRPRGENLTDYLNLLKMGLVRPSDMQIMIMDVKDTLSQHAITNIPGAANFAPVFSPDDKWIVFSSNMNDPTGGEFHLYVMDTNGNNMKQITKNGMFNSFPMFSPDGRYIAWESSRTAKAPTDINVFIAEWVAPSEVSPVAF